MQNEAWHRNRHGVSGRSRHLDGSICLKFQHKPPQWHLHLLYMQLTHSVGTDAPSYHDRGQFLTPVFSQKHAEMWTLNCAKLINAFLFASYNFKLHFLMQQRTVLSDNYFPKYSWAHVAMSIMVARRFLKQSRLRARWSHAFSSGFCPQPLRTEISRLPERPKFFAILHWEIFSLNWLTIVSQSLCTNWWTSTHPCSQRQSLWWKLLLYSSWYLDNLTCYQLNC